MKTILQEFNVVQQQCLFSLAEAGALMFSTTIMEQRDRLAVTFMEEEINSVKVQFKVFLRKYHNDEVLKHLVEKHLQM